MRDTEKDTKQDKAKRPYGTGALREVAPEVWEFSYKRKTKRFHGPKSQSENALRAWIKEVEQGRLTVANGATVEQLLKKHLLHGDLSVASRRRAQSDVDAHIVPKMGSMKVKKITTELLDDFYRELLEKGLSPGSIRKVHQLLRKAFAQAVTYRWIYDNPVLEAKPPRVKRRKIKLGDINPVLDLLDDISFDNPTMGRLLKLELAFGCRRGEMCGIRIEDIDTDNGVITIAHNVVEAKRQDLSPEDWREWEIIDIGNDNVLVVKDTKNTKARCFGVSEDELLLIKEQVAYMERFAHVVGVPIGPDSFLFSDHPAGKVPYRPSRVSLYWRRRRDSFGIKSRLHDLRHHNVSQLMGAGVPTATVAARVGHSDPSITERLYSHAIPENDALAVEALKKLRRKPAN